MTPDCRTCKFSEQKYADEQHSHALYCCSPQLKAATNRKLLCLYERYQFQEEHDWYRDTDEKRKCGPDGLNYAARAT